MVTSQAYERDATHGFFCINWNPSLPGQQLFYTAEAFTMANYIDTRYNMCMCSCKA